MQAAARAAGITEVTLGGWTVSRRRWWGWQHAALGTAHDSFSTIQ
ncbi:hypothetical protein [Jannaschia sp. R86511]